MSKRPEILAPAGDRACMEAAVHAGADAVYFGLGQLNARARATNFDEAALGETMQYLHAHGVRGYVTLNTLVFDDELAAVERMLRSCAAAGVDAVICQDLGLLRLARAAVPELPLHASTQMTCTDAGAVELARQAGAARVILARELSVDDIAAIRRQSDVELEVFVHGALCVAYSGQCLTSEAFGGRSANRGACAQACRLPYELHVDGVRRDLGERAYLLSPMDLEASAQVPALVDLGVASLKIEGRLKGPEYVAAATQLYRRAVDAHLDARGPIDDARVRERALAMYSRGSGAGFLGGVNHQALVDGRSCNHVGLVLGEALALRRGRVLVRLARGVVRGDGVLVAGGWGGEGELGGRVHRIFDADGAERERDAGMAGETVALWLGPDKELPREAALAGRRVFVTNDPRAEAEARALAHGHTPRLPLALTLEGDWEHTPTLRGRLRDGVEAEVALEAPLLRADTRALDEAMARDKLARLGDTPFYLDTLTLRLPEGATLPWSALNRARRALTEALLARLTRAPSLATPPRAVDLEALAALPAQAPPPGGLFVLCRNLAQAEAAADAGADGVYLDFLALTGTGDAVRRLRARPRRLHLTLAPPRIRKPGEDRIDRFLAGLDADAVLVRSLGAVFDGGTLPRIGDFSLNVSNRLSAAALLARGLSAITPSFDLDATQLMRLADGALAPFCEVVLHHPMPLFHMEHCVFAALLSDGHDHRDCGRPCERHTLELRDRTGRAHPVEADVGCRNTVFHGSAQSAASLAGSLAQAGVRRFRIELVRETPAEVAVLVATYRALLGGELRPAEVWRRLKTEHGYGVVRGSLRVVS